MEGAELWEDVEDGGAKYAKGAAKYQKDRQALTTIYSAMPKESELQKTTTFGASIAENHLVPNFMQKSPRF